MRWGVADIHVYIEQGGSHFNTRWLGHCNELAIQVIKYAGD